MFVGGGVGWGCDWKLEVLGTNPSSMLGVTPSVGGWLQYKASTLPPALSLQLKEKHLE